MAASKGISWAVECPAVLEMKKSGMSSLAIAQHYGVNVRTLRNSVRRHGYTLVTSEKVQLSEAELRQKAVEKAARYARTVAARQRNARVRKAEFSGMMPFSVIRRIDRLIADGWDFPRAYRAITTGKV